MASILGYSLSLLVVSALGGIIAIAIEDLMNDWQSGKRIVALLKWAAKFVIVLLFTIVIIGILVNRGYLSLDN